MRADTGAIRWRGAAETGALVVVLALAAALRIAGLRWGLPNAMHAYSYHPDEFLTAGAAFGSVYLGHSLNPHLYNYPSLYIYLSALANAVAIGYGAAPKLATIYLTGRVVTVLMGVGAVAATYWAAKTMFGRAAGIIAALVLAIAPLHVQHSHFATVDVPSTLLVAAALGFSALVLKRGTWRDYILGGAMCGLAAGTKYNAGLVVFSLVAASFLGARPEFRKSRLVMLAGAIGAAAAAFVASTPGSILWPNEFMSGVLYEGRHAATGHGLVFAGTGSGFLYTLASSLWCGLGPWFAVLFPAALVWALWRRDRLGLMMLAFVVPYYLLISLSQVRFARYALPLFPSAAVLIAWLVADLYARMSGKRDRAAWVAIVTIGAGSVLVCTCTLVGAMTGPDPRDRAAEWMSAHVGKGSPIGVIEVPWFYSPPFGKSTGFGSLSQRRSAMAKAPYRISVFADCKTPGCWYTPDSRPEWVITSDYETGDALRLRHNKALSAGDRRDVDRVLTDLRLIDRHYRVAATFHAKGDAIIAGLPHDMRYTSPSITIYRLAK